MPSNSDPCTGRVLAITPSDEDHEILRSIFFQSNWTIHAARNCVEASGFLSAHDIPVIICERTLPDGTWKDVFALAGALPKPAQVLVASRLADERLWAEVLNLGGYDVLLKPFVPDEVFRSITLAWRHWRDQGNQSRGAAA